MYVLGVTGSIGSGKTTASNILATFGAQVSHSDDLAKSLIRNDLTLITQIKERFGPDVYDAQGQLTTDTLAQRAFGNPEDQAALNRIVHPAVAQASQHLINEARVAGFKLFVLDSPLLFEAGADKIVDSVLVVVADPRLRQTRVADRSGIDKKDFGRRDQLQMSVEEKIKRADHIIHNDSDIPGLQSKLKDLYDQLTQSDGHAD